MPLEPAMLTTLDDERVIERVQAGETALFEVLMRRHNQRVYRAVRSILRDDQDVEDVMQQAWVNAYTHLGQFAGRARFSTWLTRIAAHEALARVRRRETTMHRGWTDADGEDDRDLALSDRGPMPDHQVFAGEMRALLEAAIDALPQASRQVFVLREVEGLSTADVAECLEVSEESVKTRLHRARALLREELFSRTGAAASAAFQFHLSRCDRLVAGVFRRIASGMAEQGTER